MTTIATLKSPYQAASENRMRCAYPYKGEEKRDFTALRRQGGVYQPGLGPSPSFTLEELCGQYITYLLLYNKLFQPLVDSENNHLLHITVSNCQESGTV